jgi:hypothetical protein
MADGASVYWIVGVHGTWTGIVNVTGVNWSAGTSRGRAVVKVVRVGSFAECSSSHRSFWSSDDAASRAIARRAGVCAVFIHGTLAQSTSAAAAPRDAPISWTPAATRATVRNDETTRRG